MIREHVLRTSRGMAGFVDRTDDDGELRLRDLPDLQAYCYVVAGIVGELLTELFLLGRPHLDAGRRPPARALARLRRGAPARQHPQGLRLGRHRGAALPPRGRRPRRGAGAGARATSGRRSSTCSTLQRAGAERGLVAFVALPVRLAAATLDRIEQAGPGSKLQARRGLRHRAGDEPGAGPGRAGGGVRDAAARYRTLFTGTLLSARFYRQLIVNFPGSRSVGSDSAKRTVTVWRLPFLSAAGTGQEKPWRPSPRPAVTRSCRKMLAGMVAL